MGNRTIIAVTNTRGVRLVILNMLFKIGVNAMIGTVARPAASGCDQIVNGDESLSQQCDKQTRKRAKE